MSGAMSTESEKIAARNIILSAKNHYEVMSLARTCEEDEVKKRHRELVRLVHPDKLTVSENPSQEEIHAKVLAQKVFAVLSEANAESQTSST